jgi:hypothetical protein
MVGIHWSRSTAVDRVQLVDRVPQPELDSSAVLLRIAAEAVILQDEAEAVLRAVSQHEHLGQVAPRGGPLVRRFFALREQLPAASDDPRLHRLRTVLDTILYHHAMQVATALEFLALDGRSALMSKQVSAFTGLGSPAELLDDVYRDLRDLQVTS